MKPDPSPAQWAVVEPELLAHAADDLASDLEPRPTLVAYAGDDAVARVGLRPFKPGGALQALIEVLALLLPLGADRLALAAPARVWSCDDPVPPVCESGDLRQRAMLMAIADGHGQAARLRISLHPFTPARQGVSWGPPVHPDEPPRSPLAAALAALLDARQDLEGVGDEGKLAAQFGRVLLLGHDLSLAGDVADRLAAASA